MATLRQILMLVPAAALGACTRPARFHATDTTGVTWGRDHSEPIFIYDPAGKLRLLVSANGRSVEHMASDVKQLLQS
jgi:hypothetical protein